MSLHSKLYTNYLDGKSGGTDVRVSFFPDLDESKSYVWRLKTVS